MRIEAERLTKRFGSRTSLREVSFDVPGGDIVGLLGPNGAGKSTTIRLLTGLIQPSEGTARLGGLDVRRDQVRIRPQLGYLPEVSPVFPDMTVESFLTFFAGIKGFAGGAARAEARRCAELVGLGASLDRLLRNLSKGTRQRAGIAQALLGRPKLVILDEPTSGLDPQQIVEVRAVIRSLREHATVLLSTHLLAEVEMTCDRVLVLARGRLVASGTLEEFRGAATGVREAVAIVAGERTLIDQTAARLPASITATVAAREGQAWRLELRGPEADPAWTAHAARTFVEARLDLLEMRPRRRSLEDTYLQAVQAPIADEQETAHHATPA